MNRLTLVTAPSVEPLSLADALAHLREEADGGDNDTYVTGLIPAARRRLEKLMDRAFITQTWDLTLDAFPRLNTWPIEIPRAPLQSVTSVKFHPEGGVETTFAAASYFVDTVSEPGRILVNESEAWPSDNLRVANGVIVRFVAGYGDAAADVPEETVHNLKLLVTEWYENREAMNAGAIPKAMRELVGAQQVTKWA